MSQSKNIESKNLEIIKDQMEAECLLNKKFNVYSGQAVDNQMKTLFNEASQIHKQNFTSLKTYLDSHS
ncbi:MAG: hypothetical protein ACOWWH_08885 [Eubacteriaceae bacterium]